MSLYPQAYEENMRDQSLVRDWIKSGILEKAQAATLRVDLEASLRTTNNVLRAVLGFFTMLIGGASAALATVILRPGRDQEWGILLIWALVSGVVSWILVRQLRLYRCGVEEALAILAVSYLAGTFGSLPGLPYSNLVATIVAALASLAVYLAFGYRYAIVGATVLAGLVPYALHADELTERLLSLAVLALGFFIVGYVRGFFKGEIQEDDLVAAQGAAYVGFYMACNLVITGRAAIPFYSGTPYPEWFYWGTYVALWVVPALSLWRGIRNRNRLLMDLAWLSLLATMLTNKPYLRWPRQTWDPILLGVLLMGVAIALRRWLVRGPNGERYGFTPVRLMESENRTIAVAGALSLAVPHAPVHSVPQSTSFKGDGGQSGGAGASGSF